MPIEEPASDGTTDTPNPERTPYSVLGGEKTVRALVTRFYDLMDEDPDFFAIRKLHPASLEGSREKLFMFLTGWLGGPPIYVEAFGHPRLRARHLPFPIGVLERDQWMACMAQALSDVGVAPAMRERLIASFANTADWMRNKEP
jgi:hemoglobin